MFVRFTPAKLESSSWGGWLCGAATVQARRAAGSSFTLRRGAASSGRTFHQLTLELYPLVTVLLGPLDFKCDAGAKHIQSQLLRGAAVDRAGEFVIVTRKAAG